jgi:hypothetical protein
MDHTMLARVFMKNAEILALQAEIEGMKVSNACRDLLSEAPAYPESEFTRMAEELRSVAAELHSMTY